MKDFQDTYGSMFRDAARRAGNCPPGESLADLAAGRAWPWRRRRLVEHLSHCSDCADDYRVLLTARSGLVTALEGRGQASGGTSDRWMHPGLVAAAALVVVALSVSVLIQTGDPTPASGHGVLFVSEFEPGSGPAGQQPKRDRLFASDFGESGAESAHLFRDGFGG